MGTKKANIIGTVLNTLNEDFQIRNGWIFTARGQVRKLWRY